MVDMPFPLSEDDLLAAEAACGARLPESYRDAMRHDNGGEVEVGEDDFRLFTLLDRSDPKRTARTSATELVRENESARQWTGFPAHALAFADNGAGDYLVFFREAATIAPAVYFWDHETHSVELVADDFADLSRPGG